MILTHAGAQVKDESTHAWESYPGVVMPTLPVRSSPHCTTLCGKASVNSVTLCFPLSYGRHAAPSKRDGGTLEKETDACSVPAQDNAMTPD
jgi:hypothetical protein